MNENRENRYRNALMMILEVIASTGDRKSVTDSDINLIIDIISVAMFDRLTDETTKRIADHPNEFTIKIFETIDDFLRRDLSGSQEERGKDD